LSPDSWLTISAKDFSAMFGAEEGSVYGQLRTAMKLLYARTITLRDTHPETGRARIIETRWISAASYIDGAGAIQIIFAPLVIPYITRLEREFTAYRLEKIGHLSSVHAVRLYELLVQYLSIGKREIEIDWLRDTLDLLTEYPAIKDLKKRVIDVSVAQINAHTDITTSYTQRKTGRNVTHLNFKIDAKEAAPKVVKRPSLTRAYVEKHAHPGESWEVARERLRAERGRA
jgi:plasmid replication initiation protein